MLKYTLNQLEFENDISEVGFSDITVQNYGYSYGNTLLINFQCDETPTIKFGDYLKVISSVPYYNDIREEDSEYNEVTFHKVIAVDEYANSITITAPKYKVLNMSNCYVKYITEEVAGEDVKYEYWYFDIDGTHLYTSEDTPEFYISYSDSDYLYIPNAEIIDCETFRWKYDANVENAYACKQILFPDWALSTQYGDDRSVYPNGLMQKVTLSRPQVRWTYYQSTGDGLNIYASTYKVSINVPIELHSEVRLNSEGNINEYFIQDEENNAINGVTEMEKLRYIPVIKKNGAYADITKINFNLHFREHSGDDWTVESTDDWNFSKYGDKVIDSKYYSYTYKDNQADLITYAGFDNSDVKYQKNVLKKSFIRLTFYDSMNPANQKLLGYSTIFFNMGDLYAKYMNGSQKDCYYDSLGNELSGIKVDREVDVDRLTTLLGHTPTDDEIEKNRLSCRISTEHPFISNSSSEGFYLYLWADNDGGIVPENLYMKVDFNHAGYGRTIPFMAPYRDEGGFKTNSDIVSDWNSGGYGIKQYMRYSYIRLKYMYDKENNRHIYYLDPDFYGSITGNELNINLYEARVTYEQN